MSDSPQMNSEVVVIQPLRHAPQPNSRRSLGVSPAQTPWRFGWLMAYSKHSSRTGQPAHILRARARSTASREKNRSTLPLQAAC